MKNKNIFLTKEQNDILYGLMLGDGCIQYSSKLSANPRLVIVRQESDEDYLQWQYEKLLPLYKSGIKHYSFFDKRTNKTYKRVYLNSMTFPLLKTIRNKWYTNNIKTIPNDLELNPMICLIWFCDDGSIIYRSKKAIELKLSTHGFSLKENQFLVKLLTKKFKEKFRIIPDGNHHYIVGSTKGALKFINFIDDIFPPCMARKSDKWKSKPLWDGISRGPYKCSILEHTKNEV